MDFDINIITYTLYDGRRHMQGIAKTARECYNADERTKQSLFNYFVDFHS